MAKQTELPSTGFRSEALLPRLLVSVTLLLAIACSSKGEPAAPQNNACAGCSGTTGAPSAVDFWANVPACLRAVTTLDGPNPYLYSARWSPIADFVLAGTNGEIRLIQVDTQAGALSQVASFTDQPNGIFLDWEKSGKFALSVSTDVRLLAVSTDPPRISQLAIDAGYVGDIYAVAWSPDGSHALTAGEDGTVRLLRVDTAAPSLEERAIFSGHVGKVFGVAWAPDGKHALSVGLDKTLRLLAVDEELGTISELAQAGDAEWESAVAWGSAATPLLSGTWGPRNAVQLWSVPEDFSALNKVDELPGQTPGVQVLEWSADRSRLITAEHEDTLHLFTRTGMSLTAIGVLGAHYTGVHSVGWSPDGNSLAVASSHGDILTLVDVRGCD